MNLAYSYYYLNKYSPALIEIDKVIELKPDLYDAYDFRSIINLKLDLTDDAEKDIVKAVSLDSTHFEPFANLGMVLYNRNDFENSRYYYLKAVKLNPQDSRLYFNLGHTYFAQGDYVSAIVEYETAINFDSLFIEAYLFIAQANLLSGDKIKALTYYEKILEIKPDDVDVLRSKILMNQELGNYEGIFEDYEKAIALDSTEVGMFFSRALIYRGMKVYSLAIQDYSKALVLDSNLLFCLYNRGLTKIESKDFTGGIDDLKQYCEKAPNDSIALLEIAKADIDLKQYREAIEYLSKCIEKNHNNADLYAYRSYCYMNSKEKKKYQSDYSKVKKLEPGFIKNNIHQGFIELETTRIKPAEELFNLCLMFDPKQVLPYVGLCLANEYDNTYDQVGAFKNKVISLDASWLDIGKKLQKLQDENIQMLLYHRDALGIIFK